MKIAITGYTTGIGQNLFWALSKKHDVVGFSRSNGYDLRDPATITRIVNETSDCDVLINNAHGTGQQATLALAWANDSNTQSRLVINVSSELVRYSDLIHNKTEELETYIQDKQELINASKHINRGPSNCRSTILSLGWVDTNFVRETQLTHVGLLESYNYFKKNKTLIATKEVVLAVQFLLKQTKNTYIPEISLSNWDL